MRTANNRPSLTGLLCGMREQFKYKGKNVTLWLEHETAIHVEVRDKSGKLILKDSFRYVGKARDRFDSLCTIMA